ncbi:hypothetical protein ABEB36_013729 [Hypothenemus hampei]|uniref:Uncharacterized protein n=1 Tax=Hypothenemus hampei TaxID=57062 RepID=A0ABD1E619_HYPHA
MNYHLVLPILMFLSHINYSFACNGYSIKILKSQNCVEDSIIKLPEKDFSLVLDSDCNIYGSGCVEITKDFKTAKAKYRVKKAPLPVIEGDVDLCQISELMKKTPDLAAGMSLVGIPTQCPVQAKKVCGTPDQKFSILKFKNQIGMAAGTSEIRVEIEHDNGKSCIEIQSSINKARKG